MGNVVVDPHAVVVVVVVVAFVFSAYRGTEQLCFCPSSLGKGVSL